MFPALTLFLESPRTLLGTPEVTKLDRGGNFVQRNLIYASIWSKFFFAGRNLSVSIFFVRPGSAEIAGNLPVKKKAAHINPEAQGAPEVVNLERGGHFVQRNLISASIWSKLFFCGSKSESLETKRVSRISKIIMNGVPMAPHGLIFGQNEARRLQEVF